MTKHGKTLIISYIITCSLDLVVQIIVTILLSTGGVMFIEVAFLYFVLFCSFILFGFAIGFAASFIEDYDRKDIDLRDYSNCCWRPEVNRSEDESS